MAKLTFNAEKKNENSTSGVEKSWPILIVDDDSEIHTMTRFVMKNWEFENWPVQLLNAESSEEAKTLLKENPDICLVLLDVVMESEHAGLDLVKYIRQDLNNPMIRIILRTGQPGKAPVRKIIRDYEINDYKEKSELTVDKLFVSVTAALRSYNDLKTIEQDKEGLRKILNATTELFQDDTLKSFADGLLLQIGGLIEQNDDSLFIQFGLDPEGRQQSSEILAGTGQYRKAIGKALDSIEDGTVRGLVESTLKQKKNIYAGKDYAGYYTVPGIVENILIIKDLNKVDQFKKQLLKIFSMHASMMFNNLYLHKELEESQKEVICTLGEVVESRSKETARHNHRVTEIALILGTALNMEKDKLLNLQLAAPMHDIGKIGIPDEVLHKPARLNAQEFEIMKTHTLLGYEILKNSNRTLMKVAAKIALEHHERWDGKGYPYRKKGGEICLEGRIIAIVDVFDALYNRRIYKDPWPLDEILSFLKSEKGGHFDPDIVEQFLLHIDEIIAVEDANRDEDE